MSGKNEWEGSRVCTVVIEVAQDRTRATRVLAVRDEDPMRPWDPPGEWWPDDLPGVIGVRDRLANGAWLAASPSRGTLAVLLNRAGIGGPAPQQPAPPVSMVSRGSLVLASVRGARVSDQPHTASFNLVEVDAHGATVTSWDGERVTRTPLTPGVHMIAHTDIDDVSAARIERWLPEFRALEGLPDAHWRDSWSALLNRTTELHPDDDRAIIRDNHVHGYPTQSLLVVMAEVHRDGTEDSGANNRVELESTILPDPLR